MKQMLEVQNLAAQPWAWAEELNNSFTNLAAGMAATDSQVGEKVREFLSSGMGLKVFWEFPKDQRIYWKIPKGSLTNPKDPWIFATSHELNNSFTKLGAEGSALDPPSCRMSS